MTPKQKRRLMDAADSAYTCSIDRLVLRHKLAVLAEQLRSLAAESPPKCGTCTKAQKSLGGRLKCSVALPPGTVTVGPDFGCVLHSDYESEET